jgi:hypothetical protein
VLIKLWDIECWMVLEADWHPGIVLVDSYPWFMGEIVV